LQEIAYALSLNQRKPNKSIVLLITSLSLLTYALFPGYFLDMAGKTLVLAYMRARNLDELEYAQYFENGIVFIFSFQLILFWTNMSLKTLKWLSRAAFSMLAILFITIIV